MSVGGHPDWALAQLGVRTAVLEVPGYAPEALTRAAERLGVGAEALLVVVERASEQGRAEDAHAGLVAYRDAALRVVVLASPPTRAEDAAWAGVAHELGNSLTTIRGWASVALGTLDADEARHAVSMVADSAREAMDVAPLLLLGDGREERPTEAVDAAPVIRSVVERFAPLAADRGVRLRLRRVESGLVCAPRAAIAAIAANLVKNAIEACSAGDRVEIGVRATAASVELVVEDDGRGMTESERAELFIAPRAKRRAPISASAEATSPGLRDSTGETPPQRGIGLSVVHALVHRAGGSVQIKSALGAGSCFRVELARPRPRQPLSGVRARSAARSVLVVEDNTALAELLTTALSARGIEVECCVEPVAAERAARARSFDLALVDLDLGGVSGASLVEALVRESLVRRVVVMSGASDGAAPLAHGVLRKPFDLSELDELLASTRAPRRARATSP